MATRQWGDEDWENPQIPLNPSLRRSFPYLFNFLDMTMTMMISKVERMRNPKEEKNEDWKDSTSNLTSIWVCSSSAAVERDEVRKKMKKVVSMQISSHIVRSEGERIKGDEIPLFQSFFPTPQQTSFFFTSRRSWVEAHKRGKIRSCEKFNQLQFTLFNILREERRRSSSIRWWHDGRKCRKGVDGLGFTWLTKNT